MAGKTYRERAELAWSKGSDKLLLGVLNALKVEDWSEATKLMRLYSFLESRLGGKKAPETIPEPTSSMKEAIAALDSCTISANKGESGPITGATSPDNA